MKAITEITSSQQTANVIRLAPYCRVSSDSEDQLHSFAAQIQYYTEYAQRNPQYQLVDIYADEGITGTSMEKRDDFHRLMRDCKKGLIDRIIVKSVSRFARNTEELLATLRMLSEIGVSVYFEENAIDTAMMNSEMIVTFPGMSAQQESISISENMRWSYKKRMESGEFNCCAPAYGFSLVNGQLEINEAEAAVVQRIFSLYLHGVGKQSIANMLNADGICRNHGRDKWYEFTIDYILNNERYMGDALLQKSFTTESLPFKKVRNIGQQPQYYVENSYPAIVIRETNAAAQEAGNREYLLDSLIRQIGEMQYRTSGNQQRIQEIDKEIADLSAQNLLIARLHTKGILNASDYAAQSADIGNKLTGLRIERRKKLSEDENDELLDELKTLDRILEETEIGYSFDTGLFEQIVTDITVESNSKLTFRLLGGIRLTEEIFEKGRCKTA